MDITVRRLGLVLQRARERRGWSQERVAHAAGIAPYTYRKLEHGHSNPGSPANPRLRTLAAIAEVLSIPLADLLEPPAESPNRPARGRISRPR